MENNKSVVSPNCHTSSELDQKKQTHGERWIR